MLRVDDTVPVSAPEFLRWAFNAEWALIKVVQIIKCHSAN